LTISFAPATLGNDAANWLAQILARRRARRANKAAHVVFYAGLIVGELRGLREHMKQIFVPLEHFSPMDWSAERRSKTIDDLIAFAHVVPAFGVMRQHVYSLQQVDLSDLVNALPMVGRDQDPVELRDHLDALTYDVTHAGDAVGTEPMPETGECVSGRVTELGWDVDLHEYLRLGREDIGDAIIEAGPDELIQYYLPALVWLVRNANVERPNQVVALRNLSRDLFRTRTQGGSQSLVALVQEAEDTFGKLVGLIQHAYPEIPYPTWAAR
jgi:hypothetical protein